MKYVLLTAIVLFAFSASMKAQDCPPMCWDGGYYVMYLYGYSDILYDDNTPNRVSGVAGTEIWFVYGYPNLNYEDFDPWVNSGLYRTDPPYNEQPLEEGELIGFREYFPAAGYFGTYGAVSGRTYCVYSTHGYFKYDNIWGIWVRSRRVAGNTQDCHTFPPPVPAPSPTSSPSPSPCDPNRNNSCPQLSATISITPLELKPVGTSGGNNTATVKVCLMPAVADKQVTLQLIQRPEHVNSGGHIDSLHSPTQRPLGKLLKKVGRTGTNGCFSTTYTPSHISGYVGINGQVMSLQGGVNLLTRVDGLFDLGDGENFNLTGNKPWHPQNHFGTGPANSGLRQIAEDYRAAYYGTGPMPESAKLMYNDTSLEFGGKFEIGKNWLNSGAHGEHRAGINNDTRCCGTDDGSVPAERHNNLMQIFINRGSTGTLDERRTKSPHWHLRFLFGAANAIGERTPHSFTEDVFGAALKRESNQSEYENWTARIADAKTQGEAELLAEVKALEREVFLSPEYLSSARAESGGGDEQLIDDVFWAHLFREATEEELDYWQAYLLSYSSVNMESHIATFLATFQNSSEFQSNVLAMVDPSGPSTP